MGLMVSKNGRIKDFSLPSSRKVRSSDEQNVEFEDVLKKEHNQKSNQDSESSEEKDNNTKKNQKISSGIKSYQKQEHHPNYQRRHLTAREIGSSPIISIKPQQTVADALYMMEKYKIHHLIVLDDNKLLKGIVSDRDILNKRSHDPIIQHAQNEVIITKESTELKVLAKIMLEKKISALPFIDHQEVVIGIITKTDILDYLVHSMPFETYI
jgi:acetoin utilization protein AcuB